MISLRSIPLSLAIWSISRFRPSMRRTLSRARVRREVVARELVDPVGLRDLRERDLDTRARPPSMRATAGLEARRSAPRKRRRPSSGRRVSIVHLAAARAQRNPSRAPAPGRGPATTPPGDTAPRSRRPRRAGCRSRATPRRSARSTRARRPRGVSIVTRSSHGARPRVSTRRPARSPRRVRPVRSAR